MIELTGNNIGLLVVGFILGAIASGLAWAFWCLLKLEIDGRIHDEVTKRCQK
jgi:hypothetical protein